MIFNADEAHNIVKECIEGVLGKADYNHNKVNQWTAAIVEQSLTHLVKLGKTYKYIVTCAVMQRSGAGLHTASSCFWDTTTDEIRLVNGEFPGLDFIGLETWISFSLFSAQTYCSYCLS
ncbi:dynein light chain Tctex-type 3 isoform X2 [Rhea pennata]